MGISVLSSGAVDQRLAYIFEQFDADGSGTMDPHELALLVHALLGLPPDAARIRANTIFAAHDDDGNGTLDRAEFQRAFFADRELWSALTTD